MAGGAWLDKLKDSLEAQVDPDLIDRIEALPRTNLNEFGVDPYGFDPETLKLIAPFGAWFYKNYFRCEPHGLENLPEGRFLLIGNHSGQLPFDAFMVACAVLIDAPRPRVMRSMVERWSAELPFVSSLFTRAGQVVGDPVVCEKLLRADEGVLVFPEGVGGISKLFAQRYQLARFGHGFMRLALSTASPVVPVAVIGAEEQAPAVADFKGLGKMLGLPALPLILPQIMPLPLPTKYRLWFGEPMHFKGSGDEDDDVVAGHVKKVKHTIQRMIHEGLQRRTSVFF